MKVFVYGTLKRNHLNHCFLEDSFYLGKHTTEPIFTMLNLGAYPAIIRKGSTSIQGEVYEIDKATLINLDIIEGYNEKNPENSFYHRKTIETEYGEVYIYEVVGDIDSRLLDYIVPEGKW